MATSNFFTNIKNIYGTEVCDNLKTFSNNTRKLASMMARKIFLVKCRSSGIFPKHIVNNIKCINGLFSMDNPHIKKIENIQYVFRRKILSQEITYTFYIINNLNKERLNVENKIREILPSLVAFNFIESQEKMLKNLKIKFKINLEKKYKKLIDNVTTIRMSDDREKSTIFNISGVDLPEDMNNILSSGPKFALRLKHFEIPYNHVISDCEHLLQYINPKDRVLARSQIINAITNSMHLLKHQTKNQKEEIKFKQFKVTQSFLSMMKKQNIEIFVVKSDKGNNVCILTKEQYDECVNVLINDNKVYVKLDSDPTERIRVRMNFYIKRMLDKEYINIETKKFLTNNTPIPPRFYILPKIHKLKNHEDKLKGRPVVSSVGSCLYNFTKFFTDILTRSFNSKYTCKNSFEFVEKITKINVPDDYIMISLDVEALFTSIPTNIFVRCIKNNWDNISKLTSIDQELFMNMITFIINNSYFLCSGKYYKQIQGLPMGSCLSPIAAQYVMELCIDETLKEIEMYVEFFTIYVDLMKIFCCFTFYFTKIIRNIL
jgi:hypothetical protein